MAAGSGFIANNALAAREPLLIEGTSSLYQRVLTRPGASVHTEANAGTEVEAPPVFTVYYVFARQSIGSDAWIEVGPSKDRDPVGWVLEAKTVEWHQSLSLAFTNPAGRLPVLFFDDRDSLIDFIEDERSESPTIVPPISAASAARVVMGATCRGLGCTP